MPIAHSSTPSNDTSTMNRLRFVIAIVCSVTSPLAHGEGVPYYDTAEQIKAMQPCKATVDRKLPCHAVFRTADGKRFCIQSCGTKAQVREFVERLEKGHSYALPDSFIAYEKRHQ